jgi:radical SAM protein with 4Fe4S-binding SPASM domain
VAEKLTQKLLKGLHLSRGNGKNPLVSLPAPGLYHYQYQGQGESSRVHLRLDADRRGILLVNASRVLHLNETAALMAYLALEKSSPELAVKSIRKSYAISSAQALDDYTQFVSQLDELVRPDGACPIHDLELDITAPFSARPSAPYRMDLALTYRCNDDCAHCYNARPRNFPEISASDWKQVLNRLWDLGIPHVVFTGGEPTLREDLPELVAYAQGLGQITGLNTNARRLSDQAFLQRLVDAGLDHVQITLESHNPEIHDAMVRRKGAWKQTVQGLRNALDSRLFVMTNTTLLQDNSPSLPDTLDFLGKLGVPTIGLNALIFSGGGLTVGKGLPESALPPLLAIAQQKTLQFGQRLIWYTPTQYCNFDPMQLELGVKGCTAALYNMCIEPNGDVLPCQSFYQPVGNILREEWSSIWNHELCVRLRERQGLPEKCQGCQLLAECGGGCPLVMELNPSTIQIITPI